MSGFNQQTDDPGDSEWSEVVAVKKVKKQARKEKKAELKKEAELTPTANCHFFSVCGNKAMVEENRHGHKTVWSYCAACYQTKKNPKPCSTAQCSRFGRLSDSVLGEYNEKCNVCLKVGV